MRALALIVVTGLALTGCVPAPDLQPLVDISDRVCAERPDTDLAIQVDATVAGDRQKPVYRMVAPDAPCLNTSSGKALYMVFALPDDVSKTIHVTSVTMGHAIMAPRTSVLHADGSVAREIPVDAFLFRGADLTAIFRTHPGDRFILVTSDAGSVGHEIARIKESVHVAGTIVTAYFYTQIYLGNDDLSSATWSHNGQLSISVVADKVP